LIDRPEGVSIPVAVAPALEFDHPSVVTGFDAFLNG